MVSKQPLGASLSLTEHLALLHTATILACASTEFAVTSRPFLFLVFASLGYVVLLVLVTRKGLGAANKAPAESSKNAAGASNGAFSMEITDVRRNPNSNRVEYRLEGTYNNQKWASWLRYSTLRQLKGRAGPKADVHFPEKSSVAQWVGGSETTIGFVDERRQAFNRFLKEAVPTKEAFEILAQVPQVRTALGLPSELDISSETAGVKPELVVKTALEALDMTHSIAKFSDQGGDGWNLYQRYPDGIACFLKKEGEFTYAMGKGLLDVDKLKAFEFLVDLEHRKKWDDMFKSQEELESLLKYDRANGYPKEQDPLKTNRSADWEILGLNIARTAFSSPAKAFVAERDSVAVGVMARRRSDGALCIALKSIEHPKAPEGLDGYVRAKIIAAGFLFEDRRDGRPGCVLTTMGLVDPNGSIPQFVINAVAPQRALVIRDINRVAMAV